MSTIADRRGLVGLGDVTAAAHGHHRVRRLRRAITLLGAVNVLCFTLYAIVSWGAARLAPFGPAEPLEGRFFDQLARRVDFLGDGVSGFFAGRTALSDPEVFFAVFATLYIVPAVTFCVLLAVLARHAAGTSENAVRATFRWAVAFAFVAIWAHPVLVQDFWLSAGWGRLVVDGMNPYYVNLDPDVTRGLPLDYLGLLMTYGPLWALLSGVITAVGGAHVLLTFVLFKLVLFACWVGALVLVQHLMREHTPSARCVANAIAGWLPLGVTQIVAEGHNDIAMAVLVLAWLALLEAGKPLRATAALAASVLIKYVSAPLFLLDLLHARISRGQRWFGYLPQAVVAAGMAIVVFAFFFRSFAFFDSTTHMADWHFFTPRDAVVTTARLLGIEPALGSVPGIVVVALALAVQTAFLCVSVIGLLRYLVRPEAATFRFAVLGFTTSIFFGIMGHMWPWFLVTGLLIAALHPASALTRWTVGVAVALPLPLVAMVTYRADDVLTVVTPPLYAVAILFFALAPHSWFHADTRRRAHGSTIAIR